MKVIKYYHQSVASLNVPMVVTMEIVLNLKNVIVIKATVNQIIERVFHSVIRHVLMQNVYHQISVNVMVPSSF